MKIASKNNLHVNSEKLHSYFPSWKGVRVQYRRLLSQGANSTNPERGSDKRHLKYRNNQAMKSEPLSETVVINVDHIDDAIS